MRVLPAVGEFPKLPKRQQDVWNIIAERREMLLAELVEHDMQVVFSICDRISVLHLGRSLSEGTCAEIRANPTVIAAYLGTEA